jgi:two-component system chemotaxis sensor kinase CheA
MATQAKRLSGLAEKAIMGDTPIAPAIDKLREGFEKMARAFEGLPEGGKLEEEHSLQAASEAPASSSPPPPPPQVERIPIGCDEETLQLRRRFAQSQIANLEDFEVAILECEKGNPSGIEFVKRHLHTLKGEFGVLDLPLWSDLIHRIESAMEEGRFGTEHLLRLKDLLAERLPRMTTGEVALSEQEAQALTEAESPSGGEEQAEPTDSSDTPPESTMPLIEDRSFLVDFIAEGGDHIHTIEKNLLRLETAPTDDEALNFVFRSCHTLKGLAGFLELSEIQTLAHAAESLMDRARQKELILRPEHVDLLLEVTDCFKELIAGLEAVLGGEEFQPSAHVELLVTRLKNADALPPMAPLSPDKANALVGEVLVEHGMADPESVKNALEEQSRGDIRPLGEILHAKGEVAARDVAQVVGAQIEARKAPPPATEGPAKAAVEETIRVPVQKLDLLIDAIGEAVIAQSMAWADPALSAVKDLALEKKIAQAGLMMRQIQELSMSLRMVSIRSTFQKMSRLVRDLSRKLDKQIELDMDGEDTELDKTVVENIGDPLIHMVRNSLDHGIESPAERRAAGKPEVGHIKLRAFHKAGSVHIEIEDDGKGLDREAILKKAVANGLAKEDIHYPDAEIYQMIFHPGLSTAKSVTDISGRGVGMDVVKKNIEALRGTVEIRSEKGKGTCFTIRLPLTLAIISGMVVRLHQERYIVPTLSVLATIRPGPEQLQTVVGKGELLNLRGQLIRLIRLGEVFGDALGPRGQLAEESQVVMVVEDTLGRRAGILVDEILDQQQVVIKNLGSALGDVPGISGGAIMNDGSVSLILDVGGIVKAVSE